MVPHSSRVMNHSQSAGRHPSIHTHHIHEYGGVSATMMELHPIFSEVLINMSPSKGILVVRYVHD